MKQLFSLCVAIITFHFLFAQSTSLVQPAFKIKGKVCSDVVVPNHEYVYLFVDYKNEVADSALIHFDSTFEFTIRQHPLPLAYRMVQRNDKFCTLLPKAGDLHIQIGFNFEILNQHKDTLHPANESFYYLLERLVALPLSLVEYKNLALIDSVDFNQELRHMHDSAYQILCSYQNVLHPKVYQESKRWLHINTQIAYLDFALLKRLHQKEKTFDRVSSTYTKEARKILMDTMPEGFALKPFNDLKLRVQALEAIEFQTYRFNPFEYQCEQIDMEVLRLSSPQSDGLNCNYGLVGAVGFYLKDDKYQSGWLIAPRYESLSPFSHKHAIAMQNGRVGVINACQQFTVQPQYSVLKEFKVTEDDSLPSLYIFRGAKNYGLLDHQGRQLLQENYDFLYRLDASRLAYRPINGYQYGMIDTSGKIIMLPKYEGFNAENNMSGYYKVYNRHPFLKARRTRYGQKVKIPINMIGLVDSLGKEVLAPGWNDFEQTASYLYTFGERTNEYGMVWIAKRYSFLNRRDIESKKYGYVSANGVFKLKPTYKFIQRPDHHTQYVAASKKKYTKVYFPNMPEKATLKVSLFWSNSRGNALIRIANTFYLLDSTGNYQQYGSFEGFGFFYNLTEHQSLIRLKKRDTWGLFSMEKMQWIFAPQWDRIDEDGHRIFLERDGKMSFSDARMFNTPIHLYDTVFARSASYYEARLGNRKMILDSSGNKLFESDADAIYHLNTSFFGDSNFVVRRAKQLFTIKGSHEKPLTLDKTGYFTLFSINYSFGVLVGKNGRILGYTNSIDRNQSVKNLGHQTDNPNLGKGIWRIYENGYEMLVDEEGNIKIPPLYRSVVPYVKEFEEYRPLTIENTFYQDTLAPRRYVVRSKRYYYGLYDENYHQVLDTLYWSINFKSNLIIASNKNGLYIKDQHIKDLAFIKDGRMVNEIDGERLTITCKNGKKGVYHLQQGWLLKPRYKEVFAESEGLILASKRHTLLDRVLTFAFFNAKGQRLHNMRGSSISQHLGITTLYDEAYKINYFDSNGKLLLKCKGYANHIARIPNFTSCLSLNDTIKYFRAIDTLSNLAIRRFSHNQSDAWFFVITDTKLSMSIKDVLNQIFYLNSSLQILSISAFDTVLSKFQFEFISYHHGDFISTPRQKTYYFDADSIYGIEASGLILSDREVDFANQFVKEITKDENIKWNACIKPDMLFSHLKFYVDFNAEGLRFTTYSFEDIHGEKTNKEVFYTWQELAPYLNKNHVLAKRFFGLNQK